MSVRRPVRHAAPEPGQLYEWNGGAQWFIILNVESKHRELWLCQALDLQRGCEVEVGIRKRDKYNGWYRVELDPPF